MNEIKATVSLTQALGLDKDADKKGFPGAQGELNKGKIRDEYAVKNPERASLPNPAAPKWDKPKP